MSSREFTSKEKMEFEDLVTELLERGLSDREVKEYINELMEEALDNYHEN